MSRPKVANWYFGFAVLIGTVMAFSGCESTSDPEVTGLVSRDYEETFAVIVSVDSL